MNALNDAIEKAVKDQYPDGQKPTFLQKTVKKSEKDRWIEHFDLQLKSAGYTVNPLLKTYNGQGPFAVFAEYRFHHERMWRFDRAWPGLKIAVEIEGGGFGRVVVCHQCKQPVKRFLKSGGVMLIREGSGHNTGVAVDRDMEKFNEAARLGWRVLRFSSKFIKDSSAIALVAAMTKQ